MVAMREISYACRVLRKSPVFTVTATLTLALCVGANTAIFTVVDRVLLRPLPYPAPDRLAQVVTHFDRNGDDELGQTGGTWERLRDAASALDVAAFSGTSSGVNIVAGDRPEYARQQRVSAGFFRVLGVSPLIGREFSAEEDRPNGLAAVILSHALWLRVFEGDRSAIGGSMMVRGEPHTIVGVMPAQFTTNEPADLWTPVRPCRTCEGGGQNYGIIARLKPGTTWAEADAQVAAAGHAAMRDLYQSTPARLRIVPLQRGLTADVRQPLTILWSAVVLVLLIGCVNVAGLLLARASVRAPEIATRMAIGGGRRDIVRQLLAESLVLAAVGGVIGLAIGYAGATAFARLLEQAFGVTGQAELDARVLVICGGAALLTSVVFGVWPALRATRVNLREILVESGTASIAGSARTTGRRALVVVQVALAVVLLVGAGLLIRTFDHLMALHAGFDRTHVVAATLSLQDARYETSADVSRLFDQSLARMRELPGVENAAVCLTLPFERALNMGGRWVGAAANRDRIDLMNVTYVTGGYFETLRIPLIRGRYLRADDTAAGDPVIVINETFVRRYSPGVDPIGRQIAMGGTPRRVVGIVGDIQQKAGWGPWGPLAAMPAAYIPASQTNQAFLKMVHTWFSPSWFVRTGSAQAGIAAQMQRAVQSVDPLLPFAKIRTLDDVRRDAVATQRAQAWLLGTLATLALLLAAIGLYGLVANSVAERTRELGIRLALGASSSQAIWTAAVPGCALAAGGIVIGLVLARAAASVLQHMVWGVSVSDPVTFVVAATVVLAVALFAAFVPALQVVRLNPIRALRTY